MNKLFAIPVILAAMAVIPAFGVEPPLVPPLHDDPSETKVPVMPHHVYELSPEHPEDDEIVSVGNGTISVLGKESAITIRVEGHPSDRMVKFIEGYLEGCK
jgi:hypothetical protein